MSAGDMLAVMELDDITSVMRATLYTGDFPELGEPNVIEYTSDKRFEVALNNAKMILAGYKHDIEETTSNLLSFIDDPELPLHQWNAIIAAGSAKFPKSFLDRQSAILMQYEDVIVTDTSHGCHRHRSPLSHRPAQSKKLQLASFFGMGWG